MIVMTTLQTTILSCSFRDVILLIVPEERAVFMREQASSLYDVSPYFFSKILADLPFAILDVMVFVLMMYWLVGYNTSSPDRFVTFCTGTHANYG